eukprot:CAMPEP_0174283410 /NCGR_PEP_ID=MMETSP0809-20121228/4108_1 /TAXON_ID=73025 ORGANISM="Eutreptiella gymnastica-like, Strain CCMP1594" /NCGR_SAMPLE_ID=MMETSP0809 /ASSEMBLY_ACC=CAM_ASM_000658 /LENGTH=51 /DNA_ID=CAMNT_0015378329 /DNA_START=319 /DNA_END=474 /DNA_ORIENTATION=-
MSGFCLIVAIVTSCLCGQWTVLAGLTTNNNGAAVVYDLVQTLPGNSSMPKV